MEPTGKLKFAYQTISKMTSRIESLKADRAELIELCHLLNRSAGQFTYGEGVQKRINDIWVRLITKDELQALREEHDES